MGEAGIDLEDVATYLPYWALLGEGYLRRGDLPQAKKALLLAAGLATDGAVREYQLRKAELC